MAGRGRVPKEPEQRRNAHVPARGDWQATPNVGWQHGDVPKPPTGLTKGSRETWSRWMASWIAAHWEPEDLPMLRLVIRLYDKCDRDDATAAERSELRQLADSYGITKKGQQDRRWAKPKADAPESPASTPPDDEDERLYGHLRRVV